ncbi:ubiquinol-cytochrome C reductase [Mangrovactinospora gilvigrisea]|uniref:Cytochrome bc1 complex Rieske iron-sulfur subunit n=2 Tax=Mangrovactinospora gilvigrisea TaxID=1428644 RepID=A0A1J7BG60_9ACTN|nr:Rieske 2Fe-2S domain-containing protein [Mangrovactinospora gilvigrisea]OIV37565.1 ubiquinol-cytochrome C reductase [Mangrovactinospora gilvigrisea]
MSSANNLPAEQDHGDGELAVKGDNPFADPGLPPHEHRRTDIDEKAANRAERQVAFLFLISMLATIGFIVSYYAIPKSQIVYIFLLGRVSALNFSLGLTLGVALFCIGAGAVQWARTLMSDVETPQERHPIEADKETREFVFEEFKAGAKDSAFGRRKLIRTTMFGALALVPLAGVVLLRDLGPLPGKKLMETNWAAGKRIINHNTGEPLKPSDIQVGSLTFAYPEGLSEEDEQFQEKIAKDALMLIRMRPEDIKDKTELDWSYEGIVAYSKICTHVGCPISLYEQQTHHVLCPCHQSTFDLSDGAKVIFGPAGHPLPQLKIHVGDDGFLAASQGFQEPVGPSYWERP